MTILELLKASNKLMERFSGNEKIAFRQNVFYIDTGKEEPEEISLEELLYQEENNGNSNIQIDFDGISKVKAWEGAGKKRIYFQCVGVKPSLHQKGQVFLELVRGEWIPNLRYKLMQEFANQLNSIGIQDPEKIQELYEEYIQQY